MYEMCRAKNYAIDHSQWTKKSKANEPGVLKPLAMEGCCRFFSRFVSLVEAYNIISVYSSLHSTSVQLTEVASQEYLSRFSFQFTFLQLE